MKIVRICRNLGEKIVRICRNSQKKIEKNCENFAGLAIFALIFKYLNCYGESGVQKETFHKKFSSREGARYLVYSKDLRKDQDVCLLPVYMVPFL